MSSSREMDRSGWGTICTSQPVPVAGWLPSRGVGVGIGEWSRLAELASAGALEHVLQIVHLHHTGARERVDLAHRHHVREHVAQPLRVEKVQIAQRRVIVVQQHAVVVQEHGRLVQLRPVPETLQPAQLHLVRDRLAVPVRVQHRIGTVLPQAGGNVRDHVLQRQVAGRDALVQQRLLAAGRPQRERGIVDQPRQQLDVVPGPAAHLDRVEHARQPNLFRVRHRDEPVAYDLLQLFRLLRRQRLADRIVVRADDDDGRVRGARLYVAEPLEHLGQAAPPVDDAPQHQVEAALGQEVLSHVRNTTGPWCDWPRTFFSHTQSPMSTPTVDMLMPRDVFWLMCRWPIRFAQWSTGFFPRAEPSARSCSSRLVLPMPCTPTTISFMRAYGRASSYTDFR
uniref:Uncharacterized protein n=1 Tax=Anopheles merus TaxID=30066 RepID=A0A182V7S7_ANOME